VFRMGVVVGIGLLAVGLLTLFAVATPYIVSLLVICSGLGIIFGAFGSLAVIQYKGLVVAGVAAISMALLVLVFYLSEGFLRIRLDGDVRGARITLNGDEEYPGADRKSSFEFFVVDDDIQVDRLALMIETTDATTSVKSEYNFECIPAKAIRAHIGRGQTLQWRFDRNEGVLTGVDGVKKLQVGPCKDDDAEPVASFDPGSLLPASSAWAQDLSIDQLLLDLESDSTSVRRDARNALAALGESAVRPMMDRWAKYSANYRIRLGVSVALAGFLREKPDSRGAVSVLLTEQDFHLLTAAVIDADRTLRVYATEFFYDLKDARLLAVAKGAFRGASDEGKYNLVVALKGTVPALSNDLKIDLKATLDTWRPGVGAKTQALIDEVLALLAVS
jgi:hypothetical protein